MAKRLADLDALPIDPDRIRLRKAPAISGGPEDRDELERLAGSRTESKRLSARSRRGTVGRHYCGK